MAQAQRDRLATVIRGWYGAARSLECRPSAVAVCEPLLLSLEQHLAKQTSMSRLAESYLFDNGGWPKDLSRPIGVTSGVRDEIIVATAYWRRYRQLLDRATSGTSADAACESTDSDDSVDADCQFELEAPDLSYTIKLWQRGPRNLKCVPLERLGFYEALVREAYARVCDCDTVPELANRYYSDGDWVLRYAREVLARQGEKPSTMGWIQDTACWRRFQEISSEDNCRNEGDRCHPSFALWLAQHMTRQQLSVAELARKISVEEAQVREWLCAKALPDSSHGPRLAALFGLSEAQLPREAAETARA